MRSIIVEKKFEIFQLKNKRMEKILEKLTKTSDKMRLNFKEIFKKL